MSQTLKTSFYLISLIGLITLSACRGNPPQATSAPVPRPSVLYKKYEQPQAIVHTLKIPNDSRYRITVAVEEKLTTVEDFAQRHQAIAVLNGGFFDPLNQKTTSYVTLNGQQVADPNENKRLVENPKLGPYLNKILNRSEFRQYQCGQKIRYAISFHNINISTGCNLVMALGGGPRLLPQQTLIEEGFLDTAEGTIVRDPIGSRQRNARSAVGLTKDNHHLWVMVAQKPQSSEPSGMSLADLAQFMKKLGAVEAINLDGGTSSSLVYQEQIYAGKADIAGKPILRPVKSVLLLQDSRLNAKGSTP